jgi:hypothetical protein
MAIILLDPVCKPEVVERRAERRLETLRGRRVGYVFNQHNSVLTFWKTLEQEVEKSLAPPESHRVYKTNTWAPAAKADIDELVRNTDYALVGVGA